MLKQYIESKLAKYPDEKKLDLLTSIGLGEIFPYSDDEITEATEAIRESISKSRPVKTGKRKPGHDVRGSSEPDPESDCDWLWECDEDAIRIHLRELKEREDEK